MWAYLCVSRTYRVGIVSDNRSVTYPRLSFLSPSLSFVSSTRNIFLPPRRRPFVFPPVLDCTKNARRGHFIHENNPVTGVTCLLPYKSKHERYTEIDPTRVKMIFHSTFSPLRLSHKRTSLIRSDACNCPLPSLPPFESV